MKVVTLLIVFVLLGFKQTVAQTPAQGAGLCEQYFSNKTVTPVNPQHLSQLITQGGLLSRGQEIEFLFHLQKTFSTDLDGKGLKEVLSFIELYPPGTLDKLPVREQNITFIAQQKEIPKSLNLFLKSFKNRAYKIKEIYKISESLKLWAKLLSFNIEGLNKEQKREAFLKYLNSSPLGQKIEEFIKIHNLSFNTSTNQTVKQFIEDPSTPYRQKTIVLYKVLDTFREQSIKKQDTAEKLSIAMAELIHATGFNNSVWLEKLKSKNALEVINIVRQILLERDNLAISLGFTDTHYEGLKNALLDPFNSHLVKRLNKELSKLENDVKEILKDLSVKTEVSFYKETFKLRPLSLQESPFRGCLGKDCSTRTYFEKALDPAYLYFTLTDSDFISHGQVTIILGRSTNQNQELVKTAFLEQIQNIPDNRIIGTLQGIKNSLNEQGYKLALPKDLGTTINGLSNSSLTRDFVKSHILPHLTNSLKAFEPEVRDLKLKDSNLSRVGLKLDLLEFELPFERKKDFEIQKGEIPQPKNIDESFKIKDWFLKAINSKSEKDQILVASSVPELITLGVLSYQEAIDYLKLKIKDRLLSFELRKKSLFSFIHILTTVWYKLDAKMKFKRFQDMESLLLEFKDKELSTLIGEMSNWRHTSPGYRKNFVIILSELFSPDFLSLTFNSPVPGLFKTVLDLNIKDNKGQTALHRVANHGHTEIFKLLLDKGVDPNSKDLYNRTALHYAVRGSRIGATPFKRTDKNYTIKGGYIDIVKLLLDKGVDLNNKDIYDFTVLHYAIEGGYTDIVKLLLDKGMDPNNKSRDNTALDYAIEGGYIDIVKLLIDRGMKPNNKNMHRAANHGHTEIVKFLLDKGMDPNSKNDEGQTILHDESSNRFIDIVKLLLDRGADPNIIDKHGKRPMDYMNRGFWDLHKDIFKLMLEKGANPNSYHANGGSLFSSAVFMGDIDLVRLLFYKGVDLNHKDNDLDKLFKIAVRDGHTDIVKFFLQQGVNPRRDNQGLDLLESATFSNHIDIVRLLLDRGVNPENRDSTRTTSLDLAVNFGHTDIVKLFFERGFKGNTQELLTAAIDRRRTEIVKFLLDRGVYWNRIGMYNETPVMYAKRRGVDSEMIQLLKSYEAKLKNIYQRR